MSCQNKFISCKHFALKNKIVDTKLSRRRIVKIFDSEKKTVKRMIAYKSKLITFKITIYNYHLFSFAYRPKMMLFGFQSFPLQTMKTFHSAAVNVELLNTCSVYIRFELTIK